MKSLIAALAALLVPATASAIVVYGPNGPPTLDRLARDAQRIVVATVHIDSLGVLVSGALGEIVWTRVVLVVDRTIASDTTVNADTLYSFMLGGAYVDTVGRELGMWVEDEPFSECHCNGERCLLFLGRAKRVLIPIPGGVAYRPIDPFHAIFPIAANGKVAGELSLENWIRKIEAARQKP